MSLRAAKSADPAMLVHVPKLVTAYSPQVSDPSVPAQRVAFGTSGHRGSAFDTAFNEWHILAISQAICLYREEKKIDGPLFLGMDTHALSLTSSAACSERVLAGVGYEPLPAWITVHEPTTTNSQLHGVRHVHPGRKTSRSCMPSAPVEPIICTLTPVPCKVWSDDC